MITSKEIRLIISEVIIGFDVKSLTDEMNFTESGIDSLDHTNILFEIEDRYNISIPDESVKECSSIQGIIDYYNKNSK